MATARIEVWQDLEGGRSDDFRARCEDCGESTLKASLLDAEDWSAEHECASVGDSLYRIRLLDGQIKALSEERDALKAALKQRLTDNPDPIVDGEHGLVATLVEKNRAASIDLATMAQHPELESLIVEAARAGVLDARITNIRSMRGRTAWADALMRYEMPGGVAYELRIEEVK